MADFTMRRADVFPVGSSVAAFPVIYWPPSSGSGSPPGSAATSATVQADGSVTFTGLSDGSQYVAYAVVSAVDRYVRFATPEPEGVAGGPGPAGADGPPGPTGPTGADGSANAAFVIPFTQPGTLAVGAGTVKFRVPFHAVVQNIAVTVGTAPTGANLIVDVNRNGTTLFAHQTARPAVSAGQTVSGEAVPLRTALAAGDLLTVDIDQVGSTVAGTDMVVHIYIQRSLTAPLTYAQTVLANVPVSYWRLGESSGTVAADERATNAGTYAGSPTLAQAGLITNDANTAVLFDGVDDRVFSPSINLGGAAASLECWVNVTSVNGNTPYVSTLIGIQPVAGNEFQIRLGGDGQVGNNGRVQIAGYAGGSMSAFATGNLGTGARHHLVATFAAGTMKLYIDGLLAVTNATGGQTLNANGPVQIGGNTTFSDDRWANAKIDEAAVYTTALDLATVQAHYAAGF